ncbi:MAG: hypothetical protein R2704_02070 [Microthrixaceae bacterium]
MKRPVDGDAAGHPGRTNSLSHHRDRATFIGDHRARNRLELLGVRVLLFTWWDYRGAGATGRPGASGPGRQGLGNERLRRIVS